MKTSELRKYDLLRDTRTGKLYFYMGKSSSYNRVQVYNADKHSFECGGIELKYLELEKDIHVSENIRELNYLDKLIDLRKSQYVYFSRPLVVDGKVKVEVSESREGNNIYIADEESLIRATTSEDWLGSYEERLLVLLREGKLHGANVSIQNGKLEININDSVHKYNI